MNTKPPPPVEKTAKHKNVIVPTHVGAFAETIELCAKHVFVKSASK